MSRKCSTSDFQQQVWDLTGKAFTVVSEYINCSTKIKIQHSICGQTFEVTPSYFKRYPKCLACSKNNKNRARFTTDYFKKRVKNLLGDEYTVLGKYRKASVKIKMRHNVCKHIFEVTPNHFLSKTTPTRCPYCCGTGISLDERRQKFNRLFNILSNNQFKLISAYVAAKSKIKIRCLSCNHTFEQTPTYIVSSHRIVCPYCRKNKNSPQYDTSISQDKLKYQPGEFIKLVNKSTNGEYAALTDYVKSTIRVKIKHNTCGYEYMISPATFINGRGRCPKCTKYARKQRLTINELRRRINKLTNGEYVLPDQPYYANNKPIKIYHTVCKHSMTTTWQKFRISKYCPYCRLRNMQNHYQQRLEKAAPGKFTLISEYRKGTDKIKLRCNTCNHAFERIANNFIHHAVCPKCAKKLLMQRRDQKFKQKVYNLVGNEYKVLSNYTGSHDMIKFKHKDCGHTFNMQASHFLRGNRCSWCAKNDSRSRGERYVEKALCNLGITNFEYAVVLPNKLHLDFYLPDYRIAIEYDGQQHYEYVPHFHNHDINNFYRRLERDREKDQYCSDHNIKLIRIKYTADTLEEVTNILKSKLIIK